MDVNIVDLYPFVYVTDYFDDLEIDSIEKMADVQLAAYKNCNKKDVYEIEDR